MSSVDDLLGRNSQRTEQDAGLGSLGAPPSLHTAVVTCMDARIDPADLLGLRPGESHVLRNAGGIITDDVLRSLSISQFRLGTTEVLVAQHTGCGMSTLRNDEFTHELAEFAGLRPMWSVESFTDVDASVRQGMARIRRCPFLRHTDGVRGFVIDLAADGALREVH